MERIRFQRGGTKVMERVQSPIEQLFLSEWWLYYRGDLLKWSLLLLHRIRLSINSAWACQWLSPYVTLQHSACICLLVSATTQGRLPKPRCMCRHAPAPSKTRVQGCCACPETDTSHSHGACACVSSKTLCFRLRQNQTWHNHAFWVSTTCWGDGKGMKRERFQQFQAMRHGDLLTVLLQKRRGEMCARHCSRYRELSMALVTIKGQGPEGELFLVCLLKSPEERTQTWGATLLPWDLFLVVA